MSLIGEHPEVAKTDGTSAVLSLAELSRRLREVEPAAFLVPPRIVRRVIKFDGDLSGPGLKVPHRKSYVVDRKRLLEVVEPGELGLAQDVVLPPRLILIAQPEIDLFEERTYGQWLLRTWRLLLHARVHVAIRDKMSTGLLDEAEVRRRVEQIGPTPFSEIRAVLKQEDFLLPSADLPGVYEEFASLYIELKCFAPSLLPRYFPAIDDFARVDRTLSLDVDAAQLFADTRLEGAPNPVDLSGPEADAQPAASMSLQPGTESPRNTSLAHKLLRRAEKAATVGNVVRSAILRRQASRLAGPALASEANRAAAADLDLLVERLQAALEAHSDPQPWRESLLALCDQATRGVWTSEARLLYDLQKVCVDHEREIYTVDLVEWAASRGRLAIKRPLPSQRDVLMCKHLRSAERRLAVVRISEAQRHQLGELLHTAAIRAEEQLRDSFRTRIHAALNEVGLLPVNVPERVARRKLVEELLDRIVERGFLTMGDLRDALSRNNLKLPDCASPDDFLRGDQLLQADLRLAQSLDGVYSRGEVYLRLMQRLSSLAFGTQTGRFVTRYIAMPFGGAYVALAGLQHLIDEVLAHTTGGGVVLKNFASVLVFGLFLLGLLHSSSFRASVAAFFQSAGRLARHALVDLPRWIYRQPLVRTVLQSRPVRLLSRFVIKPLAGTALVGLFFPLEQISWTTLGGSAAAVFLAMNLLLNSPLGRQAQEVLTDWLVQGWHRFGLRILTGLFYLVMDLFRSVLETIERLLYTVDEWLRFKSGESDVTLVIKAGLGVVWFGVTYVIRFCVNLLIEPQINPIKHFPVVTVSHKLLLPFIPVLTSILDITMDKVLAGTIATVVITSIPGIFGFLVWELKENWRLYAANRPRRLQPVLIGHHGETLPRLMKPGFHSGTIPKLFARLRRAERKARHSGNWKSTRKHLLALHHVELALKRFAERELAALSAESPNWPGSPISIGQVHLATNQVGIELLRDADEAPLWLSFSQRAGWLVADVRQTGWLQRLTQAERSALHNALAGFYQLAGVELVDEQLTSCFDPPPAAWDIREDALLVWTERQLAVATCYPLRDRDDGPCPPTPGAVVGQCDRSQILFSESHVSWRRWIETWSSTVPMGEDTRLLGNLRLLPLAVGLAPER
jgi:hypothetical protein